MAGLALTGSYIFVTFSKMVFLVVTLGTLHGLIFLPVFMSLTWSFKASSKKTLCIARSREERSDGDENSLSRINKKYSDWNP